MKSYSQRSDVLVDSDDPSLQRKIRWYLFQLAQASASADGMGISAKGVSGNGYSGHYFWDTEIYVLPFLTYTNQQWAKYPPGLHFNDPGSHQTRAHHERRGHALPVAHHQRRGSQRLLSGGHRAVSYQRRREAAYSLDRYLNAACDDEFLRGGCGGNSGGHRSHVGLLGTSGVVPEHNAAFTFTG